MLQNFLRTRVNLLVILIIYISLFINACSSDDPLSNDPPLPEEEQIADPEINPEDLLPQIFIDTQNEAIVDEPKINATMIISQNEVESYSGSIGIEIRGASSQMFPKKSFGLETRDENNEDLNVSLLGLPEEEDWILYAPYSDKSLLRNVLIYDLSRDIGMYASRTVFAELTINEEYQGVYVFMEKLKRDSQRIDINKLKEDEISGEDLTGGYILKIDKTAGSNLGEGYNPGNSFTSAYAPLNSNIGQEINFLYEEPDAEDITVEQKEYISSYVTNFENALASDDFQDQTLGYAPYIDVGSFIDFFLLNEISNNVDGYRLSTFMNKDKNGLLKMGPVWDFNLAFGNANYCNGEALNVWAYRFNERCPDDFYQVPFWWDRLLQDPAYVALLKERWNNLRGGALSEASILDTIETYNTLLENAGSIKANFAMWNILGTYIWPNFFIGATYDSELGYLQEWIMTRLNWMDSAIASL